MSTNKNLSCGFFGRGIGPHKGNARLSLSRSCVCSCGLRRSATAFRGCFHVLSAWLQWDMIHSRFLNSVVLASVDTSSPSRKTCSKICTPLRLETEPTPPPILRPRKLRAPDSKLKVGGVTYGLKFLRVAGAGLWHSGLHQSSKGSSYQAASRNMT